VNELVEAYLSKRLWPWPIAVAYASDNREDALLTAASVLAEYQSLGTPSSEYTSTVAMEALGGALGGQSNQAIRSLLGRVELSIRNKIDVGELETWGRARPGDLLMAIPAEAWTGGGVRYCRTCELVPSRWLIEDEEENFFGVSFHGQEPEVWFYDVHLTRQSMVASFGSWDAPAEPSQLSAPSIIELGAASPPAPVRPNKRFARRPGPAKRPREIAAALQPIFNRHHDLLTEMSERAMHEFVRSHWPIKSGEMPAVGTVKKHWNDHLERRAQDARTGTA
jgi:hypothetical protein